MNDWKEITIHTPRASYASINDIKIDECGAAAIFNLLTRLGATKDTRLLHTGSGMVVMSKVFYGNDPNTKEPLYADKCTNLSEWIEARVRLLRLKERKMNKIKSALDQSNKTLDWLKREINT